MSKAFAWPDSELESGLQVKKGNRTLLEFLSDDAFGLEPETVPVEPERPFQIIDAERDNSYSWLHERFLDGA